jgi:hypothetical protein
MLPARQNTLNLGSQLRNKAPQLLLLPTALMHLCMLGPHAHIKTAGIRRAAADDNMQHCNQPPFQALEPWTLF